MCALISDDNAGNARSSSKYSKQISSYVGNRDFIYHREKMTIDRIDTVDEKSRVFEDRFADHDAARARFIQTTRHVGKSADSTVSEHGDGESFADVFDGFPVTRADLLLVLVTCTTMDLHQRRMTELP